MRSKLVFAYLAGAAIGLTLFARGCSERRESAVTKLEAASDAVAGDGAQQAEFSLSAEDDEGVDLPEREEIRQKYRLTPEAIVQIGGINGKVKVDTTDADVAEILIVHSARSREDLQPGLIKIHQGSGDLADRRWLHIYVKNDNRSAVSSLDSAHETRQRVVLRLPRKVGLQISNIDGDVTVGAIHGSVEIMRIEGSVRVAQAAGRIKFGEIIGAVDVTFAPAGNEAEGGGLNSSRAIHKGSDALLDGNLISVRDVNGDVDLRFEGEVKANVNAWSVTGNIAPDLPNVERLPAEPPVGRLKARIGGGGAPIEIYSINGNVRLSKADHKDVKATPR